jgi:Carboxypeptidase regulatory-like domain/TonB-dependent Receptor Plug Domain
MKLLFRMGIVVAILVMIVFASNAGAQSLTLGSIAGRVVDPAGAVVPGATVNLKSLDTGETQTATTSGEGTYRFNLLKPGKYEISVAVSGFAKTVQTTSAAVGQTSEVNFALEISKAAETIEVSGAAPLIRTEPGTATSYTPEEVALLPAAGGDITTLAFTSPGVVVSQGSGYGNFTVNGLPGTSNLYTVNGENDMDPYFNINNSGAANLTLGSNEIQEATVVTNPYSAEYGQLSGAQVSYVTKSGTNAYHGNAQWWWNGRAMNSNDWFANATDAPRPFSNANQWATSVGGPVWKDHTWFFVDYEGLRFILPNVYLVKVPTPAFASAILANVGANEPNELAAYQNIMNIYSAGASGKSVEAIAPTPTSECAGLTLPGFSTPGTIGGTAVANTAPCSQSYTSTPTSLAHEFIVAGRIDQKLTAKDDLFFRFKIDHGLQPTYIDPLDAAFDANSNQPAYDYQLNWRHVVSSNMTNSFTATASHYVAQFTQDAQAATAAFPYGGVRFGGNLNLSNVDGVARSFPQGRNITQYQFIDDLSWTKGAHTLKFGMNFRRYDVSDHNFFYINPTSQFSDGIAGVSGLQGFTQGLAFEYYQQHSISTDVPIAIWGTGFYAEDSWKVKPNFTLTGGLRFEVNANPVCQSNCLVNFNTTFPNLASIQAGYAGAADVPYSSDLNTGLHSAYMSVDPINVSPRVSFSWAPNASDHFPWFPGGNKTVISGGVGIFYDNPPAGLVDNLLGNPPSSVFFGIAPLDASGNYTGILPFDATNPSSGPNAFKAASAAFNINKSYNQLSAILNPIIGFNPPIGISAIEGKIRSPQVQEWNLKVDQEITKSVALSFNYVGNHSIHGLYSDGWWNAFANGPLFAAVPGIQSQPYPNYASVTTTQSGAVANYNGLTTSVRVQYHSWLLAHVNYTYSHALDEVSNGGLFPIGGNTNSGVAYNILTQINPLSLRANNYGNADYDIRNLFNADYVITPPTHFQNGFMKAVLGGWQWSGKVFARSALPYTVIDGNAGGSLGQAPADAGGYTVALGQIVTGGAASNSCGAAAAYTNANPKPCVNVNAFADVTQPGLTYSKFPNQTRNQFRGPNYVDFDMGLYKTFTFKERYSFGLGAQAFNVFNHPNFDLPDNVIGDSTFGQTLSMQGVPSSPYGNFLGFDSSVRVVQLSLKFNF